MALVFKDRVKETTTTTGTGTVTLAGAVTGYQSFAAIGNGNSTYYCIADQSGANWEVGIGTYTSAGTTLSRTTVLASSNAGSLVTFGAGTKDVFCTYSAAKTLNYDDNGNVTMVATGGGSALPYSYSAPTVGGTMARWATTGAGSNTNIEVYIGASGTSYIGDQGTQCAFGFNTTSQYGNFFTSNVERTRWDSTGNVIISHPSATNAYTSPSGTQTLVLRGLAQTVNSPVIDATQTWNAGAVTFTGWQLNIVDTASAAASKLLDLQVGGVSKFNAQKDGSVLATGKVTSSAATSGSSNAGAFNYGTLSYSDQNNLMTLQSSVNSYNQLVLQNTSSNSAASADLTISNDQGTATSFYGNFGINSSGWLGTLGSTSLNAANAVYLTGTSGDLVLGTTTSHGIHFVVAAGADAVTIDTNSRVGIGVTSPTAALHLEAGTATANSAPLKFTSGTLLSAAEAATVEYDGVVYYTTPNTTSGRGYTPSTHIFRLTTTGSAFGPAIGNFFGANSAINLAAGGVYEIEAHCYFTKTTAGTVTVTATSSLAPVNLNGVIQTGAVGGGTAVGAANQIALYNSTATAAAFGATASLTTAVSHYMKISLIVEANASASNLRINFTSSAGTVTPLRGSYYKVTRLPAGNSGSYAA